MTKPAITLSQAVTGMLIDMQEIERRQVANALIQAKENPEVFIQYIIIQLGNLRGELDSVLFALEQAGIVTIVEEPDVTPSA